MPPGGFTREPGTTLNVSSPAKPSAVRVSTEPSSVTSANALTRAVRATASIVNVSRALVPCRVNKSDSSPAPPE